MHSAETHLKALFLNARAGDAVAYDAFLREACLLLRSFVRRRLLQIRRSDLDCEDIVQEAIIAVHAKRGTYDDGLPLTAWMYAIARYKLIDCLRATGSSDYLERLDDLEGASHKDQVEAKLTVQKVLAFLPSVMRVPIELVKLRGLSAREAALCVGTPEATVRVNIHRGLKAMARFAGGEDGEG
jgi:RNA polymerase sigma-70 factor, ECF subfamily